MTNYFYCVFRDIRCSFLDGNNLCMIHEVSPFNCKRWGHQSYEDYLIDQKSAEGYNAERYQFFAEYGINVPPTTGIEFCNNVKVISKDHVNIKQYLEKSAIELMQIEESFIHNERVGYTVHNYFLAVFFPENRLFFDRIRQIKKYQAGDYSAIDTYINSVNFDEPLKSLLTHFK